MATFTEHCGNTSQHSAHSVEKKRKQLQGLRWVTWKDTYKCGGTRSLNTPSGLR
jgi:hypothetical protein